MRARLALLTLLAGTLAGCSVRERANPFDPHNRDTSGRPIGFARLAGNGAVAMRWQPVTGEGLVGFQVWRRTGGDLAFAPLSATLPVTASEYLDRGLVNGVDYSYRLYYVFDNGLGTRP